MNFQPAVETFDANVRLGDTRNAIVPSAATDALLCEMHERGVGRALVRHAYAETLAVRAGQQMLEQAIVEGGPRLVGQTCALPTDDSLALLESLEQRAALHSVRLSYDGRQKLLFTPDFYGPLCEWLQSRGIALVVAAEAIDLRDLPVMARNFPRLPLVLAEAHYTLYLWIKPLLRSAPRLHLELSRYEPFDEIPKLVREFGAERFIYGSGHPCYAMGPILFYLHRCRFSERELALICAGNIERLLRRHGGDA